MGLRPGKQKPSQFLQSHTRLVRHKYCFFHLVRSGDYRDARIAFESDVVNILLRIGRISCIFIPVFYLAAISPMLIFHTKVLSLSTSNPRRRRKLNPWLIILPGWCPALPALTSESGIILSIIFYSILKNIYLVLHITFLLFTTVCAGNRAMRSIDPCPNCGWSKAWERGRRPTDLGACRTCRF